MSSSAFPGSRRRPQQSRNNRPQRSRNTNNNTDHSESLLPHQDWSRNGGAPAARMNSRRRAGSGGVELTATTTAASSYRPPSHTLSDLPVVDAHVAQDLIRQQVLQLTQQTQQQYPHHSLLQAAAKPNVNPAVDLAIPCISHGCCCCQCVRTQEVGFTEQCGEFQEIIGPGLHCMAWPVNSISGRLSLRIQQLDFICNTKTKDHVFCRIHIVILFRVALVRAYDAYYRLSDPKIQIETLTLDVVRSTAPSMTLDQLFASRHEIAETLLIRLQQGTREYGYEIVETLVTDVVPNDIVKAAMNEINASKRLKDAVPYKAEARRIAIVKEAEARVEAQYLLGVGVANQRRALVNGLKESVEVWTEDVRLVMPAKDVMDILLVSQYFDVLTAVSTNSSMILI
jgi:regulator of protease activity HflC (stomatin/prohibitin superfamily)